MCVQPVNETSLLALHSFNTTHHYEFVLHITNLTQFDLHRYDLQVSNDLGTTVCSVHVHLGNTRRSVMFLYRFVCLVGLSVCLSAGLLKKLLVQKATDSELTMVYSK